MKCLVPQTRADTWKEHLDTLAKSKSLKLFDTQVLFFLQDMSRLILKDKMFRAYPELIAMAYWLRKSHLVQLQKTFEKQREQRCILPRGVVLHFAPSNVDSIFIYSWVLSMLTGNANIIRLSQRQDEQMELLLQLIGSLLEDVKYQDIKDRTLVVSYEHNEKITEFLSGFCDVRVIWGGDDTINTIRSIPLPPMATEIVFADRFSSVVFSADKVVNVQEEEFNQFVHHFKNDAFWFQQMACSSPRLVIWVGDSSTIKAAKERFWHAVEQKVNKDKEQLPTSVHMTRLTTAFLYGAADPSHTVTSIGFDIPIRVQLNELNRQDRIMHCGTGLFLEKDIMNLLELRNHFIGKDQTLSYYGFSKDELYELVQSLGGRGIDRIVPVGQALDFSAVWDGYDLFMYFTREIDIR
jgi:hypothetical protein